MTRGNSILKVLIASSLLVATSSIYAGCYKHQSGWHMVSKRCDYRPALTWQVYTSGHTIQPIVDSSKLF